MYDANRDWPSSCKFCCDSIEREQIATLTVSVKTDTLMHASVSMTFCGVWVDYRKIPRMLCSAFAFRFVHWIAILNMTIVFYDMVSKETHLTSEETLTIIMIASRCFAHLSVADIIDLLSDVSPFIKPSRSISSTSSQ